MDRIGPAEPENSMVICPHCTSQFHAISVHDQQQTRKASDEIAYLRWRLETIIPLFQDARDALTAIPLASAKLRGLDLSLADKMDAAGTATREQFDAMRAIDGGGSL